VYKIESNPFEVALASSMFFFGGSATAFPPLKNKPFFAVKNFSCGGFFLVTLFLAVEEKVTGLKGFKTKTFTRTPRGMKARRVFIAFKKKRVPCRLI